MELKAEIYSTIKRSGSLYTVISWIFQCNASLSPEIVCSVFWASDWNSDEQKSGAKEEKHDYYVLPYIKGMENVFFSHQVYSRRRSILLACITGQWQPVIFFLIKRIKGAMPFPMKFPSVFRTTFLRVLTSPYLTTGKARKNCRAAGQGRPEQLSPSNKGHLIFFR